MPTLPMTVEATGDELYYVVELEDGSLYEAIVTVDFPVSILECESGATITFEGIDDLGGFYPVEGEVTAAGYKLHVITGAVIEGKVPEYYDLGTLKVNGAIQWLIQILERQLVPLQAIERQALTPLIFPSQDDVERQSANHGP
ncbi:hypothetical protein N3K66_005206 [Trichothecium roseum]|uniref:Uncharacterized protein n=1 Tax=Trichothecium roseum TaxID=47278 RepID=A0ACC0V3H4_9HYPO|nr:hypothetical protein N3K66_005206 [Trichothecium roseum]